MPYFVILSIDPHYAIGHLGYFPTYVFGAIYACQLYYAAKAQIPNLEDEIANANFIPLKKWYADSLIATPIFVIVFCFLKGYITPYMCLSCRKLLGPTYLI